MRFIYDDIFTGTFQEWWTVGRSVMCTYHVASHCIKIVRIRNFPGLYFPAFGVNTDQKNSKYKHLSRSGCFNLEKYDYLSRFISKALWLFLILQFSRSCILQKRSYPKFYRFNIGYFLHFLKWMCEWMQSCIQNPVKHLIWSVLQR